MEDLNISPQEALQALHRVTANEVTRLFSEISGRDAVIEKLIARIKELESKLDGQGQYSKSRRAYGGTA